MGGEREGSGGVWSENGERELHEQSDAGVKGGDSDGSAAEPRSAETEGKGQRVTGGASLVRCVFGRAQRMPERFMCAHQRLTRLFWLDGMR